MKLRLKHIIICLLVLFPLTSKAQFDPDNVCRVENGQIIFKLDLSWNEKQKKEIATLFELDSALLSKAYKGETEIMSAGIKWKVKKTKPNQIELSIPIEKIDLSGTAKDIEQAKKDAERATKENDLNKNFVFLADDSWIKDISAKERESVTYGVNNLVRSSIFQYKNSIAHFYLPGFKDAKKVYLAGAFNNWSTNQTLMQKVDSGWIATMKLLPGKYSYKYIADGKWMVDPFNRRKEDDGFGNINSVLFCANYQFVLRGFANAKKVVVSGSFNHWNRKELQMNKIPGGWNLSIYLKEGTYTYKFLVDNEWTNDPGNKNVRSDGSGNYNSVIGIGESYLFKLKGFTSAKRVFLAGTFNDWNSNELPMEKTAEGWQLLYILAPGMYEYKFIADGRWMTDPANPYTAGFGDMTNSVLAFKPNYTFTLSRYPNAKTIIITGNFNNWSTDGYRMIKKDGKWTFPVYLRPGKTIYKFIVDGQWMLDPDNKLWEENEYGTGNSVLWIEK